MELNFKTYGSGPPLIILHGLFGMLDNWQTLAKRWQEDFTVYVVDQRNHGKSPHVNDFSYPLLAEDLLGFLDSQWIFRANFLGHSMGGKTAMKLAMDHDDRVNKLVVVDMGTEKNTPVHEEIFDSLLTLPINSLEKRSEADAHLAKLIENPGTRQFLMKNLSRNPGGGFRWKMNVESLYENYAEILAGVEGNNYEGPSLFVRGGLSNYLPEAPAPELLEKFPNANLVTIPEAGHWVHADKPEELFQTVRDFLLK
ncbi:MAG: alpha/beta fold hydrolase [Saprospiraceae bacterium]|nr:alpha/beta fold hydrolase [Saprospiraceae bacterium]